MLSNIYVRGLLIAAAVAAIAVANNHFIVEPAKAKVEKSWQDKWSKRNEDDAKANLASLASARAKETAWQERIDAIQAAADADAARRAGELASAKRESDSLRTAVASAIAQLSGKSPGAASSSPAGRATGDLLAELFGELDQRATELAEQADHARYAGLQCEAAYQTLRETK